MLHPEAGLTPLTGIDGHDPVWRATGTEAWFKLALSIPASGGWLKLGWDYPFSAPVMRPVLRFVGARGEMTREQPDILLCGAPLGRAFWLGHVPAGTEQIHLSPCDHTGAFGFRLIEARWIPAVAVVTTGLRTQPLSTLHALGAAAIGRPADFRLLLEEATNALPMRNAPAWLRAHQRVPDWAGFDCVAESGLVGVHVFQQEILSAPELEKVRALPPGVTAWFHPMDSISFDPSGGLLREVSERLRDQSADDLVWILPPKQRIVIDTLPALVMAATHSKNVDFFYGDELQCGRDGRATEVVFRTGFDPLWTLDSLHGSGAIACRLGFLRRLVQSVEGIRSPIGEALYRPLLMRKSEAAGKPALSDALIARMVPRSVEASDKRDISVNIVIPSRDRLDLLRACVESILPTLGPHSGITIVDNDSVEPATKAYFSELEGHPHIVVLPSPGAFNFSRLSNEGARARSADMLVFLNNDTTVLTPDWLDMLAGHAMQQDVGAVGAKLFYPSGRIQHGGVALGIGGFAGHIDLGAPGDSSGTLGRLNANHSLMAVTGACLAVARTKFEAIGGFDEINLPVDLNDIDFCLRLAEKGWRTVFAAQVHLVHHESASRGRSSAKQRYRRERAYFLERWGPLLRKDAYYHPALSLMLTRPSLGAVC